MINFVFITLQITHMMLTSNESNTNNLDYTYKINISGILSTVSIMILMSLVISVLPLLLNNDQAIFYTSQSLYIAVILLFVTMMYFDWWGLLVGLMTFIICGWVLKLPLEIFASNTLANILQMVLLLLAYKAIKRIKSENKNMYYSGELFMNLYNYSLILIFLFYLVYVFTSAEINLWVLLAISIAVLCLTLAKSYKEKDVRLLLFNFMVALIPSLVASTVSYYLGTLLYDPESTAFRYITTWTLSNYILLQTIGYWFYQYFFTRNFNKYDNRAIKPIIISTVLYYGAAFVWNMLIILMLKSNVLGNKAYMYFFPWALGNIFLLSNLYFSSSQHIISEEEDRFKWFEGRIIVVEKNTSTIIMIIAFLLPLSLEFLQYTPDILKILFAANIFCTCTAVGLIWIPQQHIKFVYLLKSLKTICYTYSISLLLLCVILILSSLN